MDSSDARTKDDDRSALSSSASLNGASYSGNSHLGISSNGHEQVRVRSGYTLMVAGRRSGKTSFLRLLIDTCDISPTATKEQLAALAKFVQNSDLHTSHIRTASIDIELDIQGTGFLQRLTLSLIDTPSIDFDDESHAERVVLDTLRQVDSRFAEGMDDDWRTQAGDHHVHLCIYFLDPDKIMPPVVPRQPAPLAPRARTNSFSQAELEPPMLDPPVTTDPRLCKPALPVEEINTIRRLSARVNVLPVIARADRLTNERLAAVKVAVRRDLAEAGIGFGIFDMDNHYQHHKETAEHATVNGDVSNGYSTVVQNVSSSSAHNTPPISPATPSFVPLPYALVSPDIYSHSDGVSRVPLSRRDLVHQYTPSPNRSSNKIVRGRFTRSYRWGCMDILDPNHNDFLPLRTAIFHHMETLQKYTKEYLFDKFRADYHHQHATNHSLSHHISHSMPTRSQHSSHAPRPILAIDTAPQTTVTRHPSLSISRDVAIGVDARTAAFPRSGPEPSTSSRIPSSGTRSSKQRLKKITVACNFCRSRKLKCDGGRPACSQCVKRSNPCDYQAQNKRRGTHRQRKAGEDSYSESGEEPSAELDEHSLSPEVPSLSLSGKSSNADKLKADSYTASLSAPLERREDSLHLPLPTIRSHPVKPPPSPKETRSYFPDNELPHIATLSLPENSPSGSMTVQPFSSIRPASDQQTTRRRSSTMPGKSRQSSNSGPKVVACNFCRARKTKCDGGHPACSSCQRRSLPCNYVHDTQTTNSLSQKKAPRRASTSKIGSRSSPSHPTPNVQGAEYRRHDDTLENGVVELKRSLEDSETSQHHPKKLRVDSSPMIGIP